MGRARHLKTLLIVVTETLLGHTVGIEVLCEPGLADVPDRALLGSHPAHDTLAIRFDSVAAPRRQPG